MIKLVFLASLSFQCLMNYVTDASSTEIVKKKKDKIAFIKGRPAPKSQLKRLLTEIIDEEGDVDTRLLALSWMETRMRPYSRRGDKGKACGLYQIHARYSYPMFKRKKGFIDYDEKKERLNIFKECRNLEKLKYSVKTMRKYLALMDKKELHPCHHNSGFYGKCNSWYKKRVTYWNNYFALSKLLCDERIIKLMAILKTGNPIPTAPANLIQGYLDGMENKGYQSEDSIYKSGYDLALLVKEGKAEAPVWASHTGKES